MMLIKHSHDVGNVRNLDANKSMTIRMIKVITMMLIKQHNYDAEKGA